MKLKTLISRLRMQLDCFAHALKVPRYVDSYSRPLQCAQLEPRILMSASPMAVVAEAVDASAGTADQPEVPVIDSEVAQATLDCSVADDSCSQESAVAQTRELVLVDTSAENYQQLIDDILDGSDETRCFDVFAFDSDRDGVEQITELLSNYRDVDAIHIVSHGSDGNVRLGNSTVNIKNLAPYAGQIAQWGSSFSADADLLFYGCDLAASDYGQQLVHAFGVLTGADVAASDDLTGHESLGADWDLEFGVGTITTDVAFSQDLQDEWFSVLTVTSFQEGTAGYSGTQDTQVDAGSPGTPAGSATDIEVDNSPVMQGLIRFDNLFGSGPGQIPVGSTINSAELTVTVNNISPFGKIDLHRMLVNWDESSTWSGLTNGVSLDDVEAESVREDQINGNGSGPQTFVDLAETVQGWADGDTNYGWVLVIDDSNSWIIESSEGTLADRPVLTIDYTAPGTDTTLRVNARISDEQITSLNGGSATARAANGNSVVVWSSKKQDNGTEGSFGVYAQLYDDTGARISGEIQVNSYVSKNQQNPSVATDDAGNFVVVWESQDQDGGGYGIYMQRFNATGAKIDGEILVNTVTANDQLNASVAMDNDGDFVVVWKSNNQDGDGWGVYGQRFNSLGAKVGTEFIVPTSTSFDQTDPSVALNDAGQFVVTWTADGVFGGDGTEILAQRYDSAGNADGLEFQVNSYLTNDQFQSSVSMNDSGNFVVVWTSDGQDGDSLGIYGRTFNSDGTARNVQDVLLPTNSVNEQQQADVKMRDDGDFLVTWTHLDTDSVFYRHFNLDAVAQGPQILVDTTTTNQARSAIGFEDDGGHTLVWMGSHFSDSDAVLVKVYDGFVNEKPTVTLPGGAINYAESDPATILDAGATVSDTDSLNFDGGALTVEFTIGGGLDDRLGIRNEGTGPGQIGISGSNVTYGLATIGSFSGGTDGLTPLVVSLNASADVAAVQALARNITYRNISDGPTTDARNARMYLADGDGGVSLVADKAINVSTVNDAPVISGPITESTIEDTTLTFEPGNGNAITVSDPDIGTDPIKVTLTISHGELDLGATNFLTFQTGDGNADSVIVFTGTVTAVNNALDGLAFSPPQLFVGTAILTIEIDDQGSSGAARGQVVPRRIPGSFRSR